MTFRAIVCMIAGTEVDGGKLIYGAFMLKVPKELMDVLVCPKCQGKVELNEERGGIVCKKCKLVYPVTEDIPVMLIDSAKPIEE